MILQSSLSDFSVRRIVAPPEGVQKIIATAASVCGLPVEDLIYRGRTGASIAARIAAMRQARVAGYSLPEIARGFHCNHTTVMRALQKLAVVK